MGRNLDVQKFHFTANSVFCKRKCAKWRFEVEKIGIELGRKKEFAARVYRSGHPIDLKISLGAKPSLILNRKGDFGNRSVFVS